MKLILIFLLLPVFSLGQAIDSVTITKPDGSQVIHKFYSSPLTAGIIDAFNLKLSTATAAATYQPIIVSGTNIKTVNGSTLLGSGDLIVSGADATKLAILNNLSDLNNAATARTNLGLGTLATQNGTIADYLTSATAASTYATITNLNLKAPLISPTFVTPVLGAATATTINGGTLSGNNSGDNATNTQYSGLAASKQDVNSNLTTIAGLTATTDNFMVATASAWASRTPAQAKTSLSLNNVENTALSTWAGSANITTLGTIGTGTWQGGVIGSTYGGTGVNNAGRTLTINTNSGTLAFGAASKTLTINNSIGLTGTDATTMTFPSTSATIARTDAANTFTGVQTFSTPIAIGSGGTGGATAQAGRLALLPSITGNTLKFLRVNAGETDYELVTLAGGGDALTSAPLSQFASTTSAQLGTVLSDETGTLGGFMRGASAKLTGDYTNATTTGTEVTGLQISSTGTGVIKFEFYVLLQSGTTTTGWKFGINHTGTATVLALNMTYPSTGTTAATGVGENIVLNNTGSIYEAAANTDFSTTAPNLGPTAGVAATGTNVLVKVFGLINCTVSGDLELWAGAETTGTVTVKTGSVGMAWAL